MCVCVCNAYFKYYNLISVQVIIKKQKIWHQNSLWVFCGLKLNPASWWNLCWWRYRWKWFIIRAMSISTFNVAVMQSELKELWGSADRLPLHVGQFTCYVHAENKLIKFRLQKAFVDLNCTCTIILVENSWALFA